MRTAEAPEAATANFVVHVTWAARRARGSRVDSRPSLTLVDSGLDSDTFNIVCAARLGDDEVDVAIREVLEHFRATNRAFSWWVAPGDLPGDLLRRLEQSGLGQGESELAMAADLGDLPRPRTDRPGRIEGIEVRRVRQPSDLAEFARITSENWQPPDANVETFYARSAADLLEGGCPMRYFLAYLDGRAVAAVEVTLAGGVAGVYNLSTRAPHRRRGIASVLLEAGLHDARQTGTRTAVLQAAAAGVGLYRRLGFREFGLIREFKSTRVESDKIYYVK